MKRLALVAAVMMLAACTKSENAAQDTTTPAMAPAPTPAPAMTDSAAKADSVTDTTKAATDTTKKP